ncbi:oligogalacturonate lyase family protein [Novosphingobium resinovorum]|uniref:oligogalacturonate lyase family protein n=1 Tax=Novosphingobium resinovorum TaxID=158500 RepID=UPI002ED4F056|nr:oligogalacturonate lyase family protein [Novosphingobium resinovorum]
MTELSRRTLVKTAAVIAAVLSLAPSVEATATDGAPATSWIDPVTRHRIVRIDDSPGNYALYFNYNPFTPDGKRMVYLTPEGIRVASTADWSTRLVLRAAVDRLLFVGHRAPIAYYTTKTRGAADEGPSVVWSVDLDTGRRRRITALPGGRIESINADDTLLAGHYELSPPPPAIAAQGMRDPRTGSPAYAGLDAQGRPLSFADAKAQWMAARLAAGVPMEIFSVDIRSGERRTITRSKDWLNHVQFSPTDPALLMYCHEGPWEKVDRIWTIRTDGSAKTNIHRRTMQGEIAGHEYWAPDGNTLWYDLIMPQGGRWLAGRDVRTGARRWYALAPGQGSYHFSTSPDGRTFSGDGGQDGKYISLFHPRPDDGPSAKGTLGGEGLIATGTLDTERLVDLTRHDYTLEPNQHFTPNGRWLVYRSNVEGKPAIYAVSLAVEQ